MSFPILIERYDSAHPADVVVCESCRGAFRWDPAEGDPYDLCAECKCGGSIVFMYSEAPKCGGCGKLGRWSDALKACCSRACMLQAEYAATLKASDEMPVVS